MSFYHFFLKFKDTSNIYLPIPSQGYSGFKVIILSSSLSLILNTWKHGNIMGTLGIALYNFFKVSYVIKFVPHSNP